ncbi:hypothetical protein ACQ4W6_21430, partial [Janthinobacterium sp. HLX7-2]
MDMLNIELKNCYGINELKHEFDFSSADGRAKSYAIYAPNGLMKTSFSRTFESISNGQQPSEERYNRVSGCVITIDGEVLEKEDIYVLKSDIDSNLNNNAITNILVDPAKKTRYDEILIDLDKLKNKLILSISKNLTLKKSEVEARRYTQVLTVERVGEKAVYIQCVAAALVNFLVFAFTLVF